MCWKVLAEGIKCIKGEHLCHTPTESQSSFTILNYQFSTGKLHNQGSLWERIWQTKIFRTFGNRTICPIYCGTGHALWGEPQVSILTNQRVQWMLMDQQQVTFEAYDWLTSVISNQNNAKWFPWSLNLRSCYHKLYNQLIRYIKLFRKTMKTNEWMTWVSKANSLV